MQKNLYGMLIEKYLNEKAYEEARPIHATFELTPRCNFNCCMCYVHLPVERILEIGRELTADEWLEIGRQACEMGILSICITGGDPISHPEFKKIWVGLSKMGFRLILQTNASQLTEDILEVLEEYPPDTVKITLYGSNDEVYREVCKVEKGFTRTDKGIKALQERGFLIQLVTTFVKQNKEDAKNIAEYARKNHLAWIHSRCCYPSIRGAQSEAAQCALSVWDTNCMEETITEWTRKQMEDGKIPVSYCRGYRKELNVLWNGNLSFCLFVDEMQISAFNNSLQKCWEELLRVCSNLEWPQECKICEYRNYCRRCLGQLACFAGGLGKINKDYCNEVKKLMHEQRRRK